jgi:hypothetical protein
MNLYGKWFLRIARFEHGFWAQLRLSCRESGIDDKRPCIDHGVQPTVMNIYCIYRWVGSQNF